MCTIGGIIAHGKDLAKIRRESGCINVLVLPMYQNIISKIKTTTQNGKLDSPSYPSLARKDDDRSKSPHL
jgi:hypothetical protein